MKYEIINPSDKAFIEADDFEVAAVACVLIGRGQYALDPVSGKGEKVPIFLFGGHDAWFREKLGRPLGECIDAVKKDKLAALVACLRSAKLDGERPSLNNFTGYAHKLADKLESEAAPDPGRPAQVVFCATPERAKEGK